MKIEEQVARRLMGDKPRCRCCEHWDEIRSWVTSGTEGMGKCSLHKKPVFSNRDYVCGRFSTRTSGKDPEPGR